MRGTFQFNKRTFRQETVDVNHIDTNSPTIVWESEGNNEDGDQARRKDSNL